MTYEKHSITEDQIMLRINPYIIMRTQLSPATDKILLAFQQERDNSYACKRIVKWKLNKHTWENLHRGIHIHNHLCTFGHSGITRIHDVLEDAECKFIIMERMDGDLIALLEKNPFGLKEDEARCLFRQAIEILQFVHAQGIAHRDVKLDNFLFAWTEEKHDINKVRVSLTDFEFADYVDGDRKFTTPCGSPSYAAPELCCANPLYNGQRVDVWACGILLFALLCGRFPWSAPDMLELFESVLHDPLPIPQNLSSKAIDLLQKILTKEPLERITIDQILLHPWMMQEASSEPCQKSSPST